MSDKAVEEVKGRAKEAVGAATGKDDLKSEGEAQQEKVSKEQEAEQKQAEANQAQAEAQQKQAEANKRE